MDGFQAPAVGTFMNDDICYPHGECRRNRSGQGKIVDDVLGVWTECFRDIQMQVTSSLHSNIGAWGSDKRGGGVIIEGVS